MADKKMGLMSGIGAGLGILGGVSGMLSNNSARQYQQQKKLTELQVDAQKELGHFNKNQAKMMWEETGPVGMREQLEKAGLSTSLMYGMGGAGGATTQGAGAGAVSGGVADGESARLMAKTQLAGTMAQIDLTRAQTEKTKAEADNIAGGVAKGLELDNIAKEFQNNLNTDSREDQIDVIRATAEKLTGEANKAAAEGAITQATQEEQINKIKSEATGAMLENQVKQQGINLSETQIKEINAKIEQGWVQLSNQRRGQDIDAETAKEMMKTILISSGIQAGGNLLNNLIEIRSGKFMKNIGKHINGAEDGTKP